MPEQHFLTSVGDASIVAAPPIVPTIVIPGENGRPLLKIHPNGTLEYGPDYTPDEAARRFWDAVRQAARTSPGGGH